MEKRHLIIIMISVISILYGCPPEIAMITGDPPIANAGDDFTVETGSLAFLSGSDSTDPDGDELTFIWTFSSVPSNSSLSSFNILGAASPTPGFTPDVDGDYILLLSVSDGEYSAEDTVKVSASTTIPVAKANDQSVKVNTLVKLDGSASSDPDGSTLSYRWELLTFPVGSDMSTSDIINAEQSVAEFTPVILGEYSFRLTVSDGKNQSSVTVLITVKVSVYDPIADAGSDQVCETAYNVTLDGSGSYDEDGDDLHYLWTFFSTPASSNLIDTDINGSTTVMPHFIPDVDGEYVIELSVNDGRVITYDTVTVLAHTGYQRPTSDAGDDVTVETGYPVTILNGDESSDPNGDNLNFEWSFAEVPSGSILTDSNISSFNSDSPVFTPDVDGNYQLDLTVDDGTYHHSDIVLVTAQSGYYRPTAIAGDDIERDFGASIQLDGSSSYDPNGDTLLYSWSITASPEGSAVNLTGADSVSPVIIPDVIGEYIVTCTVSDGYYSHSDELVITATPVYVIGEQKIVSVGDIDVAMRYVPGGLIFPIERTDTLTYGSINPGDDEYLPGYWVAETEATNELIVEVLNWALDNGRLSDAELDAATLTLDGRILFDLVSSSCTIEYNGSSFAVKNQSIPNPDIDDLPFDNPYFDDELADYLAGTVQPSIDMSKYPCSQVSWYGAVMFSNWITEMVLGEDELVYSHPSIGDWNFDETVADYSKKGFRLPESMEWECAARYIGPDAPSEGQYTYVGGIYWTYGRCPSGGLNYVADYKVADHPEYENPMLDVGWYLLNSHETDIDGKTSNHLVFHGQAGERDENSELIETNQGGAAIGSFEVAKKMPNALGLYDMSGNVWELCFTSFPDEPGRIIRRGGGFPSHYMFLELGRILSTTPAYSADLMGLRLFMSE